MDNQNSREYLEKYTYDRPNYFSFLDCADLVSLLVFSRAKIIDTLRDIQFAPNVQDQGMKLIVAPPPHTHTLKNTKRTNSADPIHIQYI